MQFQAEIASVPDHVRLYKNSLNSNEKIVGIFCAPLLHERNINTMQTILQKYFIKLNCFTDRDFINLLNASSKEDLLNALI